MVKKLTFQGSAGKWYPAKLESLKAHLGILIRKNNYFTETQIGCLKGNIAYSLQYVEFLNQISEDIKLSSVLSTQNTKNFVVCGASIIEALFYYIVISGGKGATTEWQSCKKVPSTRYEVNKDKFKMETELFIQVLPPRAESMTLDQLCKKVESHKMLGNVENLYKDISRIRKLRNKIHIHGIEHSTDTDWYNFNSSELRLIKKTLYGVLTSSLFLNSPHSSLLNYLK